MKTTFLWGIAIAALVFTGCSKSEVTESLEKGTKLSFRLSNDKTTRAVTEVATGDLETAATLNLYAYNASGAAYNFLDYSSNTVVLGYVSTWTPATDIYLKPEAGGVYPISLRSTFPSSAYTGGSSFDYTITYDTPVNDDIDLLVVERDGGMNNEIADKDVTSVNINYTHALAQVIVTVTYKNPIPGTYAKVENCIVSAYQGTCTYNFGSGWTAPGGEVEVPYKAAQTTGALAELDRFVYFPQTLPKRPDVNDGQTIKFDWGIYVTVGNTPYLGETNVMKDIDITIAAGYRYYLDIIIDGGTPTPLGFTVSAGPWENSDPHSEIDVP